MTRDWKDVDTSRSRPRARRTVNVPAILVGIARGIVAAALILGGIALKLATDEADALRAESRMSCPLKPNSAVVGWRDPMTGKARCDYRTQRSPVVLL